MTERESLISAQVAALAQPFQRAKYLSEHCPPTGVMIGDSVALQCEFGAKKAAELAEKVRALESMAIFAMRVSDAIKKNPETAVCLQGEDGEEFMLQLRSVAEKAAAAEERLVALEQNAVTKKSGD